MMDAWIDYDDVDDRPRWEDLQTRDKKLETIEDFFKGALHEIYGTDELDYQRLEWYLDEIAHQLELKLPERPMMIMRLEMNK